MDGSFPAAQDDEPIAGYDRRSSSTGLRPFDGSGAPAGCNPLALRLQRTRGAPWHDLYFFPELQGHRSFRATRGYDVRFESAAPCRSRYSPIARRIASASGIPTRSFSAFSPPASCSSRKKLTRRFGLTGDNVCLLTQRRQADTLRRTMDKRIRRNEQCVIGLPRCDYVLSSGDVLLPWFASMARTEKPR
jgi:hypothetical protein